MGRDVRTKDHNSKVGSVGGQRRNQAKKWEEQKDPGAWRWCHVGSLALTEFGYEVYIRETSEGIAGTWPPSEGVCVTTSCLLGTLERSSWARSRVTANAKLEWDSSSQE